MGIFKDFLVRHFVKGDKTFISESVRVSAISANRAEKKAEKRYKSVVMSVTEIKKPSGKISKKHYLET